MTRVRFAGVGAIALMAASPSFAHHSFVAFDLDGEAFIEGEVQRFALRNPHTYIILQVPGDDGETVSYRVESEARNDLVRAGWTNDSLARGDMVTVRVNPARDPNRPYGRMLSLEKADGTVLSMPEEEDEAGREDIVPAESLEGVWLPVQTFFLMNRALEGKLNEAAAAAIAEVEAGPPPQSECIDMALPNRMARTKVYEFEFVSDELILIHSEDDPVAREVHMDGRGHPEDIPEAERTFVGHSIGQWDGDTLVVDTQLFAPQPNGLGAAPSSGEKHMIERYTLSEDGTEIAIEVTVEDPVYVDGVIEYPLIRWQHAPDVVRQPYSCDLEAARGYLVED